MAIDQPRLDDARKALVEEVQTLVGEVVFNKTYFSLEETGLGYGVIRRPDGLSTEEYERLNAFLRVFTDAYRVQGGRWNAQPRPWASVRDIPKRSAVRRLAERIWAITRSRRSARRRFSYNRRRWPRRPRAVDTTARAAAGSGATTPARCTKSGLDARTRRAGFP